MTCSPEHLEQLLVLCMVAFFGYNILLDLVVIRVLIRQEGCKAVSLGENELITMYNIFNDSTYLVRCQDSE